MNECVKTLTSTQYTRGRNQNRLRCSVMTPVSQLTFTRKIWGVPIRRESGDSPVVYGNWVNLNYKINQKVLKEDSEFNI